MTIAVTVAACAPLPTTPPAPEPPTTPPVVETPTPAPQPAPQAQPERPPQARSAQRTLRGKVSTYGAAFAGRKTASGDTFDPDGLTMAHRTLPFGTRVRVTNLENNRSVEVVVNDRGPAVAGRIADLSTAAARQLGMIADGVVDALLEIVSPAPH